MKKSLLAAAIAAATVLFAAPASATLLTGTLAVDNEFQAYFSTNNGAQGSLITSGNNWQTTYSLSQAMTAGQSGYLHIVAHNTGGPGGFLGAFAFSDSNFKFANGTQSLLTGDSAWTYNTTGWTNTGNQWFTPVNEGTEGVSPWGTVPALANANPTWIWNYVSNTGNDTNTLYFSAKLISNGNGTADATGNVPEPASLALFGLGIAGIAAMRKRRVA